MKRSAMTANDVIKALRAGPLREPAHAWLYEVRNRTGYGAQERYADALVVSLWPSRGIWFAGVEVKVDRSDWLRELDKPEKSTEIQKFCDYWWVAAPNGVVRDGEVPENWGHYVVGDKKVTIAKAAPELEALDLSRAFVASVLRNAAQGMERARSLGRDEGKESTEKVLGDGRVAALTEENIRLAAELQRAKYGAGRTEHLEKSIAAFEEMAGFEVGTVLHAAGYRARDLATRLKAADALAIVNARKVADHFREAAKALDALAISIPENGHTSSDAE